MFKTLLVLHLLKLYGQIDTLDIDECASASTNDCDKVNGVCTNTPGSYECSCKTGWKGNGKVCEGKHLSKFIFVIFR